MKKENLFAGTIVNTHGIRGDVKLHPGAVDLSVLAKLKTVYIHGNAIKVLKSSIQKTMILYHFDGTEDMDSALALKGTEVFFRRTDVQVPENYFFDEELTGLQMIDSDSGKVLGTVQNVLEYPAQKILEVTGEKTYLIPYVWDVFIQKVNLEEGKIYIHYMKGLAVDED